MTKKSFIILISCVLLLAVSLTLLFGANKFAFGATNEIIEKNFYRPTLYTITDDGQMKNTYDEITWRDLPNYSYLTSKRCEYVTVTIEFQMCEIDDGWQDVYLYYSTDSRKDDYIDKLRFDYGGSGAKKDFDTVYVKFKSLPLNHFVNPSLMLGLVVRYDAYGAGRDTWQNKECNIKVQFSENIINSVYCVEGNVLFNGQDYN